MNTKSAVAIAQPAIATTHDRPSKILAERDPSRNASNAWTWTFSVPDFHGIGIRSDGKSSRAAAHDLAVVVVLAILAQPPNKEGKHLAFDETLVKELVQRTSVSARRVKTSLRGLRRHVHSYKVSAGELWPDGSTCRSGGRVYDLTPILGPSHPFNGRSMVEAFDDDLELTLAARLQFAHILKRRYKHEPTKAWPAIATFATVTRTSPRSVLYAMRELEGAPAGGFGKRKRKKLEERGNGKGSGRRAALSRPSAPFIRTELIPPGGAYPTGTKPALGGAVRIILPRARVASPPCAGCVAPVHPLPRPRAPVAYKSSLERRSERRSERESVGTHVPAIAREVIEHFRALSLHASQSVSKRAVAVTLERLREGVDPTRLIAAIDGAHAIPWRRARPATLELEVIFRDRDQVEKFSPDWRPPLSPQELEHQRTQRAAAAAREEQERATARSTRTSAAAVRAKALELKRPRL